MGNTLTKFAVRKIEQRQEGISTLGSLNIWYDETVQRLNTDERGLLLGAFSGADRIITFTQSGQYRLTSFDLSTHFDEDMMRIEKYDPERVYTVVYQENESKHYYIKRFTAELTERKVEFVEPSDRLILFSADPFPRLELLYDMKLKTKGVEQEEIVAHEFIGIKGYKAKGKRLTVHAVKKLNWIESLIMEEPLISDSIPLEGEIPAADEKPLTDKKPVTVEKPAVVDKPAVDTILAEDAKPAVVEKPVTVDKPAGVEKPAGNVSSGFPGITDADALKTGTRLKFRVDSIGEAEKTPVEKTDFEEEIQPTIILLEEPVSLSEPSPELITPKKRERRKKQESVPEQPKTGDEPGDAIQMELPL
jgi:topoisomerase-4 subunit A